MNEILYKEDYNNLVDIEQYKQTMDQWVKERPNVTMLITGPSGSGKTVFVTEYLKANDYTVHFYNSSKFEKKTNIHDILFKIFQNNNIKRFFVQNFKLAVVIDELEGISINDKGCISEIIDFIKIIEKYKVNKEKNKPCSTYFNLDVLFICIGQDSYIKKIKNLEKICYMMQMNAPSTETIKKVIRTYLPTIDLENEQRIIEYSEQDFRKCKQLVTGNNWDEKKIKYYKLEVITNDILYNTISIDSLIRQYNNEKILLPLMLHQNYKPAIFKTLPKYTEHCYKIADLLSNSDVIGSYIFQQNEWDICDYYAINSCYRVYNYISSKKTKTLKNSNEILFTKLLNKTSLKCSYKHTYNNCIPHLHNYFIDSDIVKFNICKMKALLEKNPNKYNYLLGVNHIENENLLTKIDKCL